ncbi:MAG: sigma-70 factor domain-containing protein, partial [Chloroflexota bacterium]
MQVICPADRPSSNHPVSPMPLGSAVLYPFSRAGQAEEPAAIDDMVRLYLREIGAVPRLSPEDETAVAETVRAGETEVIRARSRLALAIRLHRLVRDECALTQGVIAWAALLGYDPTTLDRPVRRLIRLLLDDHRDVTEYFAALSGLPADGEGDVYRTIAALLRRIAEDDPSMVRILTMLGEFAGIISEQTEAFLERLRAVIKVDAHAHRPRKAELGADDPSAPGDTAWDTEDEEPDVVDDSGVYLGGVALGESAPIRALATILQSGRREAALVWHERAEGTSASGLAAGLACHARLPETAAQEMIDAWIVDDTVIAEGETARRRLVEANLRLVV